MIKNSQVGHILKDLPLKNILPIEEENTREVPNQTHTLLREPNHHQDPLETNTYKAKTAPIRIYKPAWGQQKGEIPQGSLNKA